MREIKFRIWDSELDGWVDDLVRTHVVENYDDPYAPDEIYAPEVQMWGFYPLPEEHADRFVVEQYTGLHDKNGKKIYEGDIVLCNDTWTEPILDDGSGPSYDYKYISNVIFSDGSFGVRGGAGSCSLMFSNNFLPFDNGDYYSRSFNIIGNIHENPELLNET